MAGVVFVICLLGCFYNPNVENGLNNANLKEEKERPAKDTRGSPTVKKEMKKRRLVDTGVWKNQSFVKILLLAAAVRFGQYSPTIHLVI